MCFLHSQFRRLQPHRLDPSCFHQLVIFVSPALWKKSSQNIIPTVGRETAGLELIITSSSNTPAPTLVEQKKKKIEYARQLAINRGGMFEEERNEREKRETGQNAYCIITPPAFRLQGRKEQLHRCKGLSMRCRHLWVDLLTAWGGPSMH